MSDTENSANKLAGHSCHNCKGGHRKCDRKLPICGLCALKGKDCSYDEAQIKHVKKSGNNSKNDLDEPPKKKLRKSQSPRIGPGEILLDIVSTTATSTQQNSEILTIPHDIQDFVNIFQSREAQLSSLAVNSMFERQYVTSTLTDPIIARNVLTYLNHVDNGTLTQMMYVPHNDDLALFFAMKAHFLKRFFLKDAAQQCFEKARDLISESFDTVLTNASLAAACSYIGAYLQEDNEMIKANFYNNNVQHFLQNAKTLPLKPQWMRLLDIMSRSSAYFASRKLNLVRIVKGFIYLYYMKKKTIEPISENSFKALSADVEQEDNTKQRFVLDLNLLEHILTMTERHYENIKSSNDLDAISLSLMFILIVNGAKLELLPSSEITAALEVLHNIARLIADPSFVYSHHTSVQPIIRAIAKAIELLPSMENVTIGMDMLRKFISVFHVMEQKYKFLSYLHGDLITQAENIIKIHDDQKHVQSLCSTWENSISKVQNTEDNDLLSGEEFFLSETEVFNLFGDEQNKMTAPAELESLLQFL